MSPEDDAAMSREQRALGPKYVSEELTLALQRATRAERQLADAFAEGRRLERAAIVADLRACAEKLRSRNDDWCGDEVDEAADRYERGEHERKGT